MFPSSSIRLGSFRRSTPARDAGEDRLRNVEPYGGLFAEPDALRAALKKHKLAAPDAHMSASTGCARDVERWPTIAKDFGIKVVIVPAVPQRGAARSDAAGWEKLGKELAGYQKKLAAQGVDFAWHNHAFEFAKLPDGTHPLDHIFAAAPGLLWQADIGWIEWAGESAAAWIDKYKDRVVALHVKDLAPKGTERDEDGQADVGHGVLDWKRLMPAIKAPSVRYLVLEHDNPTTTSASRAGRSQRIAAW